MRLLKSTRLIPRLGSEETRVHAPQLRDRTKLSGGRKLRHELKFIINEGTYLMLRARLAPLMTVDPHGSTANTASPAFISMMSTTRLTGRRSTALKRAGNSAYAPTTWTRRL